MHLAADTGPRVLSSTWNLRILAHHCCWMSKAAEENKFPQNTTHNAMLNKQADAATQLQHATFNKRDNASLWPSCNIHSCSQNTHCQSQQRSNVTSKKKKRRWQPRCGETHLVLCCSMRHTMIRTGNGLASLAKVFSPLAAQKVLNYTRVHRCWEEFVRPILWQFQLLSDALRVG